MGVFLFRRFLERLRDSRLGRFARPPPFVSGSLRLVDGVARSGYLASNLTKSVELFRSRFARSCVGNVPTLLGLGLGFGLASSPVLANSEESSKEGREMSDSPGGKGCRPGLAGLLDEPGEESESERSFHKSSKLDSQAASGGQKFKIFIGYDPREDLAFEVCRYSILKRSSIPIEIVPIVQSDLRKRNLYWRERGAMESTEFSFSRFLTPFLAGFDGWALFVDCDFLYTTDIKELVELMEDKYAVMCVQHDYKPKETTKMDGAVQTTYPRKNWSSMVLYNCGHAKNRILTPEVVNTETGAFLHRFTWLDDSEIGSIPFVWNFLVGHNRIVEDDPKTFPKAIHYTLGGPWFEKWKDCEFGDLWVKEMEEYQASKCGESKSSLPEPAA